MTSGYGFQSKSNEMYYVVRENGNVCQSMFIVIVFGHVGVRK